MKVCSYNTDHYEPTQVDVVHARMTLSRRVADDAYQERIIYKLHQVEGL